MNILWFYITYVTYVTNYVTYASNKNDLIIQYHIMHKKKSYFIINKYFCVKESTIVVKQFIESHLVELNGGG